MRRAEKKRELNPKLKKWPFRRGKGVKPESIQIRGECIQKLRHSSLGGNFNKRKLSAIKM